MFIKLISTTKKVCALLLVCAFVIGICGCKAKKSADTINRDLDLKTPVSIIIAGRNFETWPALENVISKFEKKYTNCSVTYEYIQGDSNVIKTRLDGQTDKIDIFVTANIQEDSSFFDNALDLLANNEKLDLSDTNTGIVNNFKYLKDKSKLYAIPYGGEMRGLYVNKTLLAKYGLKTPKNRKELLNCCEVLFKNGNIPFQASSASFAQQLLYPSVCNRIVNGGEYEKTYKSMEEIYDGISNFFENEYSLIYDIVSKGYFDYKRAEEETGYTFSGQDGKALDFLNITKNSDKQFKKQDDIGKIAFMTDSQAFMLELDKAKKDYHSEIEYEFILAPVGDDGGYAYLSPSSGLAVNKNSDHTDWALEFMDYFFCAEVNKEFAKIQGCIPNTTDALVQYDVSSDRVSTVGDVTFSYPFYKTVITLMTDGYKDESNPENDMIGISKMNAKKYMNCAYSKVDASYISNNADETFYYKDGEAYKEATADYRSANPDSVLYKAEYSLRYTLKQYLERLELEFQKVKQSR